jgi:hypothetical protein
MSTPTEVSMWLLALALAQDPVEVAEPFPIRGDSWHATVSAYALPVQDPRWLTDDRRVRTCRVLVTLTPGGQLTTTTPDCPDALATATAEATAAWRFDPADDAAGDSHVEVVYVVGYDGTIGTMTMHAEVDPGDEAVETGERGPPGVKLVRHPRPTKEKHAKARDTAPCDVELIVDIKGKVASTGATTCPDEVAADASKAASKWRFLPLAVDGLEQPGTTTATIRFD